MILVSNERFSLNSFSDNEKKPVIIYISSPKAVDNAKNIYNKIGKYCIFCELSVDDWDKYLTPWKEDCLKGRLFGGEAHKLLDDINSLVFPSINKTHPDNTGIYLVGYSLAGLFSLWCMYETSIFDGAASCSGSLWYPDWSEYVKNHNISHQCKIYLSLGDSEEKTKHPMMKRVGTSTRLQNELLISDKMVLDTILKWNRGGHFSNIENRVLDGISWLLGFCQDT